MKDGSILTISDLPEDVQQQMRDAIRKDSTMQNYVVERDRNIRNRDYVSAMRIKKKMDEIENRVISEFLSKYQGEQLKLRDLVQQMSPQDAEEMAVCATALTFLVDLAETCSLRVNGLLKKYYPNCELTMYNKWQELLKASHQHMQLMADDTSLVYQDDFANDADDVQDMFLNKIKGILKRTTQRKKTKKRAEK